MRLPVRRAIAILALTASPLFASPPGESLWTVDTGG